MKPFRQIILLFFIVIGILILFHSCEKLDVNRVMKVETGEVNNITSISAEVEGEILDLGGNEIIQHGHCWAPEENPTIELAKTSLGGRDARGKFQSPLQGLEPGRIFYVKAYATDNQGITVYGSQKSFITISTSQNTFIDARDGHEYRVVSIGEQVWMAENLAYLPAVCPPSIFSYTEPCFYVYGYYGDQIPEAKETGHYHTYGVLYNWSAAMQGASGSDAVPSGVKGICPDGWHMPSNAEWEHLIEFIANDEHGGNEGTALKAKEGWDDGEGNGTDDYGFAALPGGIRDISGDFDDMPNYGKWWTSTENTENTEQSAWKRILYYGSPNVASEADYKEYGLSIRCIRDI